MSEVNEKVTGGCCGSSRSAGAEPAETRKPDEIRRIVRDTYASVATADEGCGCGCSPPAVRDAVQADTPQGRSAKIGYSEEELASVPEGSNMGLGCGNPKAIAALQPGETVLDLGSGGGFDCFLAAQQVGESGRVIGIDMTPEMVSKARENAEKDGYGNVEFRLGEIEHIPAADSSVNVIISNCVINLSPDKQSVYNDTFRVLKPGGRLAISDVVALKPLPDAMRTNMELHAGCVAGASVISDIEDMLGKAGFENIRVNTVESSRKAINDWMPEHNLGDYIVSGYIEAVKPS